MSVNILLLYEIILTSRHLLTGRRLNVNTGGSQGLKVHPLSEGLPQFTSGRRRRSTTVSRSDEAMLTFGFVVMKL